MMSKRAAGAALVLMVLAGAAHAQPRPNGDSGSDLAPLDTSGHSADQGGIASGNTPPIGGATQGGGGNPKESGPVDAARTGTTNPGDKNQQPDNK